MPWLSRQNSMDDVAVTGTDFDSTSAMLKPTEPSAVTFIPAQIDGLCGTNPSSQQKTATRLLWDEVRVLVENLRGLPAQAKAACNMTTLRAYMTSSRDVRDMVLQMTLLTMHLWMLFVGLPLMLIMPGSVILLCGAAAWGATMALSWPMSGDRVVMSSPNAALANEDFSDERWIFVNGMMTSNRTLRAQCDLIAATFGRPVTGIHSATRGPVLDLLQPTLNLLMHPSPCTRTLTSTLRDVLLTNSTRKVLVLTQGSGASPLTLALDALHATLPPSALSKLELYTFSAGASHLSNPLLRLPPLSSTAADFTRPDGSLASPVKAALASLGHRIEDHERVIPHIEHYAAAASPVARSGVLHAVRRQLDNRFCGRVFALATPLLSASNTDFLADVWAHLDTVVDVDADTAEKREFLAQGNAAPIKLATSPRGKRGSWGTAEAGGWDGVGVARAGAREAHGRTVRQLSRLWRFRAGGRPVGEGVAVVNGVGMSCEGMGMIHGQGGERRVAVSALGSPVMANGYAGPGGHGNAMGRM